MSHKKSDADIDVIAEFGECTGQISLAQIEQRAEKSKPTDPVTYKMIQQYVKKKYGFHVHSAYIAEVKRSLGLPVGDAPNAVEELKRPRNHPPKEKIAAIRDALRYFHFI